MGRADGTIVSKWVALPATIVLLLVPALPGTATASDGLDAVRIQLSRHVGPPTTPFKVSGMGFDGREVVDVAFDDEVLTSATTGPTGSFATKIQAPASALPGTHVVSGTGETSGLHAERSFLVRTDWPTAQFEPGRTGSNPYENVLAPDTVDGLTQAWDFKASDAIIRGPAIAGGMVFFTSDDDAVYALDEQQGSVIWTATVSSDFGPLDLAAKDGRVYVPANDTHAFDARTGEHLWAAPVDARVSTGVLPVGDLVYLEGSEGSGVYLYALDASTGATVWRNFVTHWFSLVGGPPSYADGVVYSTVEGPDAVLAFDARSGDLLWGQPIEGSPDGSAAVSQGVLYVATQDGLDDGSVTAFDAKTGEKLWEFREDGVSFVETPLVADGRIIVASHGGFGDPPYSLYALDAVTGEPMWVLSLDAQVGLAHPVEANGVIYLGENNDQMMALDATDGHLLWNYTGTGYPVGAVVADGTLYFGSFSQDLYAFRLPSDRPSTGGR